MILASRFGPRITGLMFAIGLCVSVQVAFSVPQLMRPIDPSLPAPDFNLLDLEDQSHSLETYEGRPLIVNFWATWCPPCREEMPSMERAWQKIKSEGIGMVGINVGEDFESVFGFLGSVDVSFPLLLDTDSAATSLWPIRGLPTSYVLNSDGEIVYEVVGGREWDEKALLDQIRELIN